MSGKPWTPTEDALAVSLRPAEAAAKTGRTVRAVYQRRLKLGAGKQKRRWSTADDRIAWRLKPRVAAARLGRTVRAVLLRRVKLAAAERAARKRACP